MARKPALSPFGGGFAGKPGQACGPATMAKCPSGGGSFDTTGLHLLLGGGGALPFVGAIADIIDAGVYAAEGDLFGAGLSIVAAVPLVGDLGNAAKVARVGTKVVKGADEAVEVARVSVGPASVIAKNGETAATALGRATHQAWDYGAGFTKEYGLPSGQRVDAVNFATRGIRELKPNNPRAIRLGRSQIDRYLEELNRVFPGDTPWTGEVVTYP